MPFARQTFTAEFGSAPLTRAAFPQQGIGWNGDGFAWQERTVSMAEEPWTTAGAVSGPGAKGTDAKTKPDCGARPKTLYRRPGQVYGPLGET